MALEEGHWPFVIDDELETVGPNNYAGKLEGAMTAHPKTCAATGEMLAFAYSMMPPFLTYYRISAQGELLQVEPGLAEATLAALRHRWPVNLWPEPNLYFGGVHAVAPRRGQAAGDARRGGAAQIVA